MTKMGLAHNLNENERTKDIEISQNITFDNMLLSYNTLEGLKKSGFIRPSPIQLHSIPLGKCGFDLLLEAKSGTGKTAVFTIVMLEKIDIEKGLQVIVLAPTREIAAQICDVIRNIGCQYEGLNVEVVMGGLPVQDDIEKFQDKKVHIVVGSPGRLKHLIKDKHIKVNSVRLLVIDEADKLMEKCFLPDIRYIYSALPQQKQVIMCSATYPDTSKELINEFIHDAQYICPSTNSVLLGVIQKYTLVKCNNNTVKQTGYRFDELLKIITKKQFKQCLIFCNYQARVGELYKMLIKKKWPAEQLYGAQDQIDRLDALKTLQEYKCRILISTDLAARGIDASNVDLVINFEPPFDWQTYLHRIGRAGRFGSYGMAITILSKGVEEQKFINLLATVNLSVNLSLLWNDNEDMNQHEIPLQSESNNNLHLTKNSKDHNYKKIWNLICQNEESSSKENDESFNDLCISFEEAVTIESFSDLLMSYENCQSESKEFKDLPYKCIKWPELSTYHYLGDIKKQCEMDYKVIETVEENDNQLECAPNNSKNDLENINYNQLELGCNHPDNVITQTLEYKDNSNKLRIRVKNVKGHNVKVTEKKLAHNHSKQKKLGGTIPEQKLSCENMNNIQESLANKRQINKSKDDSRSQIARHYHSMHEPQQHSNSEKHFNLSKSEEHNFENSYISWYKQLKSQVRQIELTSYIDELSKLY